MSIHSVTYSIPQNSFHHHFYLIFHSVQANNNWKDYSGTFGIAHLSYMMDRRGHRGITCPVYQFPQIVLYYDLFDPKNDLFIQYILLHTAYTTFIDSLWPFGNAALHLWWYMCWHYTKSFIMLWNCDIFIFLSAVSIYSHKKVSPVMPEWHQVVLVYLGPIEPNTAKKHYNSLRARFTPCAAGLKYDILIHLYISALILGNCSRLMTSVFE